MVSSPPPFKKRPTYVGKILATIFRLTTSSANSCGVQAIIGRPDNCGSSHATLMIWQMSLAVKVGGVPERGRSDKTVIIDTSNSRPWPLASIPHNFGPKHQTLWTTGTSNNLLENCVLFLGYFYLWGIGPRGIFCLMLS